jgi:signal transduction histidine kinase
LLRFIDVTVQVVRRIAADLRPALLEDFGLAAANESHVEEFERRTGITGNLVQQGDGPEQPREVAMAVFRVLQESLTNVARHARATDVDIHLDQLPEALLLRVRDYGQGFDMSETAKSMSLGLAGMRERIIAVRGSLEITTATGAGTTVLVRIPRG